MTEYWLLRLYLLAGLVTHKVVWERLKLRLPPVQRAPPAPILRRLVKRAKLLILLGIIAQTLAPEVFPITASPGILQLVGVSIYTAGLLTAIVARLELSTNWSDIEAAEVRRNQLLVSNGIYRYIRHPIYSSDLALLLGLELCLNSWLVLGVGLLVPIVVRLSLQEERLLIGSLPGYGEYCRQTKRFVPFLV